MFSALLLVALVALSAPLLALIPHAAIAGLLLLVAWTLLDTPRWRRLLATQRGEAAIAAATLAATVTIRMEVAILLGTVLSLMAYLHRTSRPAMRIMGFDGRGLDRRFVVMAQPPQPGPARMPAAQAAAHGGLGRRGRARRSGCTNCAPRRTRRVICWSWPRA